MCFFPFPNFAFNSPAYRAGIHEFKCGSCPECLSQKASPWVLRSFYEQRDHLHNCMITLTYDNYEYDSHGRIVGELPPDRDLHVCKRDVQLFVKRLRKYFSNVSIKYIITAEYGSRTHRAHYHALLFGVDFFEDRVPYKLSKRGNQIYTSSTLTSLWGKGICTVDNVNLNASTTRYCTKYLAKSRSEDTFMLFSHKIGLSGLLRDFNGKSYFVEGREYPVPRSVWETYIMTHYSSMCPDMSPRYVNYPHSLHPFSPEFSHERERFYASRSSRMLYRAFRDSLSEYQEYLSYWHARGQLFENLRSPVADRIALLSDEKYHFYKLHALRVLRSRVLSRGRCFLPAPSSSVGLRAYESYLCTSFRNLGVIYDPCRIISCHNTASDTTTRFFDKLTETDFEIPKFFAKKSLTFYQPMLYNYIEGDNCE